MDIIKFKVTLAETRLKNKWLADDIGKEELTISQSCINFRQLSLENFFIVTSKLEVDIRDFTLFKQLYIYLK